MHPVTRAKITVLGKNKTEIKNSLLNHAELHQIPKIYGGEKDLDFDD